MTDPLSHLVEIEFQRVQTFLFAVPRLADIVGANAMLGETLRYELPRLAKSMGCQLSPSLITDVFTVVTDDPLNKVPAVKDKTIADNPCVQWSEGILARDGGHFRALFENETNAKNFVKAARFLLWENLPGLRFTIETLPVSDLDKNHNDNQKTSVSNAVTLFNLPFLQVCQDAGNGVAVEYLTEKERSIGLPAQQAKAKWRDFKNDETHDIAAVMMRASKLANQKETFDDFCEKDYLAVIHADGNGLGKMKKAIDDECKNSKPEITGLDKEARIEAFFHQMRSRLRIALADAIKKLYQDPIAKDYVKQGEDKQPQLEGLQILMLGGDDLLIACRAPLALPLVKYLAEALEKNQADAEHRLTLGIGVAIAKPAFPFHRLHELAEELASSAKRLARVDNPVSVVDWAVCSEAWHGDVADTRRKSLFGQYQVDGKTETLALSRKPYRVLKQNDDDKNNLEFLLEQAKDLNKNNDHARSQLRELKRLMGKGKRQADFAYQDLQISSPTTWESLEKIFGDSLWQKLKEEEKDKHNYVSQFADLVEIMEIKHLHVEYSPKPEKGAR